MMVTTLATDLRAVERNPQLDENDLIVLRDASEAATRLGHATYSGTVSPASRRVDNETAD